VPDPITTSVATAIATQAAQTLTTQTTHALAEITRRIQSKFRGKPADLAVLANAQNEPCSSERISMLAQALWQAAREDTEFGQEILALWTRSQAEVTSISGDAAANVFHGQADKVVQLHDVHGDLTIS
jgi:hypothetical protein